MLDRLQEDGRLVAAGLAVGLHQPALEGEVLTAVAQARVLVRLGVGVDADDARGRRERTSEPYPSPHAMSITRSPITRAPIHS